MIMITISRKEGPVGEKEAEDVNRFAGSSSKTPSSNRNPPMAERISQGNDFSTSHLGIGFK